MNDDNWMEEYKQWRTLQAHQLRLLDEGPKSQSQAWLFNSMWCDWRKIRKLKDAELPSILSDAEMDPWAEENCA